MSSGLYEKISRNLGKTVEVRTIDDRVIIGRLTSFNPEDGSVILENAYEKNRWVPSVYINGSVISQIYFLETEEKEEKERFEETVKALYESNLTVNEIARIMNVPINVVEDVIYKLTGRKR
mgnify:CR=1 FL=1